MKMKTVCDILVINGSDPYQTKSGGKLEVVFALPLDVVQSRYFNYDSAELDQIPKDIRGLRVYTVANLPKGTIGGTEYHLIREEMVFGLAGSVQWVCEDLNGNKREFMIHPGLGIWMPPSILHTYRAEEDGSGLLVVANTLFDPEDKRTHDTYPAEKFKALQKMFERLEAGSL